MKWILRAFHIFLCLGGLVGRNGLARRERTFHSFPSKNGKNIGSFNEIKAK